ncbi:hypothetical protein GUITHDRAFT_121361 [Guillardia theta CCMP2712]|uniref:Uncharacterized protein n=1 Tax=Guillardia theta (strain CCMP2712) TaxID=905079 RepID=L1I8Q2_GUITC|nr:hypothetical protein GUITHDRAFT_121361 [Guillardia theta CCMP2712]EKX32467.1 hypothetical protein GUITHDRAFT_121361 [Guillardia theta CCMP2712]|eukprot:XP_005819447.1 hypothetical protein GUITHDRAFT_121361 [Guillardia theta CCMP2712]
MLQMLFSKPRFSMLFDNVNPFTEEVVGEWNLPDGILLAPAGGLEYPANDPATQYYGPDGVIDFTTPVDVSGY